MRARRTLYAVVLVAAAASLAGSGYSAAASKPKSATVAAQKRSASAELATGRQLYREFCGKCHALSEALSAGFGSESSKGFGSNGGPSFNDLRVPFDVSINAITEPTGGHELVKKKIKSKQLTEVATYLAKVTKDNPIPALPTDG